MNSLATSRNTEELQVAYSFWLSHLTELNLGSVLKFKKRFPSLESWEQLSHSDRNEAARETLGVDYPKLLTLNLDDALERAMKQIETHKKFQISLLPIESNRYPYLLKQIPDPPMILFVKGSLVALLENKNVAVIGTRDATQAGAKVATKIANRFGEQNWCVVSGLAKGIDAAAHKGALDVKARTVAVMATPLDKVYPAENRELAYQILDGGGCWVSELPLFKSFHKGAFVQRDRIQSGMSVAVIPVQTDVIGGTMHTVKFAEQQKRLLFCPRPIEQEQTAKQYAGIKQLIENRRARPFEAGQYNEIIESMTQYWHDLTKGYQPEPYTEAELIPTNSHAHTPPKKKKAERPTKPRTKRGTANLQEGFEFFQQEPGGPRRKGIALKMIESQIMLLEQLKDEIIRRSNLTERDLEELFDSKIRSLRRELVK